ncbi:hypothetical protein [Nonomuraea ceibae]|uniref:hypothetical protein n=1 Tax=Nonomuraea ceibae TaxID=1935170 RepID=UPI001C5E36BF|nr:hypothetical protein [Nonomuraea ceibae]
MWHPVAGTVIQSPNDDDHGCWATALPGRRPDADGAMPVEFLGGNPYRPRHRTPDASVVADVRITGGQVRRSVRAVSAAATAGGLEPRRAGGVVRFSWGAARPAAFAVTSVACLRDGRRRLHVLRAPHDGTFDAAITFDCWPPANPYYSRPAP